jgi:RimJ/RimL family protein N-acetyltransferase
VIDGDVIAETDRVVLRPWRVDEADRLFDMRRRMEVARWIGGRPMVDRMEAVGWIERISALLADDPRYGAWAVVERPSGVPAGSVLLKPLPDGRARSRLDGICIPTVGAADWQPRPAPRCLRAGSRSASTRSGP